MKKLSSVLKINEYLRIREFDLRGNHFKVRVPVTSEMEEIVKRIDNVSENQMDARLKKMKDAFKGNDIEGVEVTDDDIVVDGRSTKETIRSVIQMENRIVEYFKFLVPVEGDLDGVTYEDIENEFPLQVQFELLEKITELIQPGYKDAKKN